MTGPLVWRVSVALVLAALAGLFLGCLFVAMWQAGNQSDGFATVLFGVAFVGAALSVWATEGVVE